MRTKSLVLIMIALGCGLVASIGISQVMERREAGVPEVEMEEILVASIDIDIGKKIDPQNVKLEQWPKNRIPEGVVRKFDDVKESYTRARLYAGEPLLTVKLMDSNNPSAGGTIPDGYVVIPIKVELDTVIGLIQPGDLVDVMVFLRQGPDIPKTGSYTILRMVRVFAVNAQTDRAVDDKGQEISAKTVSVLVKPKQGERLMLATEMGKLRLALRRPSDAVPSDDEVASELPSIFRDGEKSIAIDATKSPPPPVQPVPVPVVQQPVVTAPPVPEVNWTMQVFSPHDIRKFDWSDEKALPSETLISSTPRSDSGSPATPGPVN